MKWDTDDPFDGWIIAWCPTCDFEQRTLHTSYYVQWGSPDSGICIQCGGPRQWKKDEAGNYGKDGF